MTSTPTSDPKGLKTRLLSGSFVLLAGSGLVSGINFAYNIAVARFLGPTGFGHASAVYTLLILVSAVTLSFQIVSAKVVAQQKLAEAQTTAYFAFHKSTWRCGIAIALMLALCRSPLSNYLNLPGSGLVIWLAIGVAFYVPLGARRGYLQGTCRFGHLAQNLILEGFCRLSISLAFIAAGYGVTGVIAANAAAVAIAYFFALPSLPPAVAYNIRIPDAFREALQAIVFFVGQVIINNCDIVLVKHFFLPTMAGVYAAIALVGRVIFAFSWAVVNTMFPIMAGTRSEDRRDRGVLRLSLLLILGMGLLVALVLRMAPAWIWTTLFGPQFLMSGKYDLPYLLSLYAITTCFYSLSVAMIAYEMSYRIANAGWTQLAFSGVLIAGIYRFHSSLQQVVFVQFILMIVLLAIVSVPYIRSLIIGFRRNDELSQQRFAYRSVRTLRRVSEDFVMAEFLKNDFYSPEFSDYQESLRDLVTAPDLSNAMDNARRRALLFIRHGALWRELPKDTEWFEVHLGPEHLESIRVFPRAQWRKVASGDFRLTQVLRSLRSGTWGSVEDAFLSKIWDLRACLNRDPRVGAILVIGLNETSPLTILDGNHRVVAAVLNSPSVLRDFRFLCGLSPNMTQCCWYKTNLSTLCRYAINRLLHAVQDPEAELTRLLES